jgi:hypothetical protein
VQQFWKGNSMSINNSIKIEPNKSRHVEYCIRGYLVRGSIPIRADMNPSGRYYAGNHDENKFFRYIASYLNQSDPLPHTIKLNNCPPMTLVSVSRTKVTSQEDEERLLFLENRQTKFGKRKSRDVRQKAMKSAFSLYMDRPFEP